jgi:hypothetical protein
VVSEFPLAFHRHHEAQATKTTVEVQYNTKVETPTHDNIRELVTWECKEHGVKS